MQGKGQASKYWTGVVSHQLDLTGCQFAPVAVLCCLALPGDSLGMQTGQDLVFSHRQLVQSPDGH